MADHVTRYMRLSPFAFYCDILFMSLKQERSYDSIPNFTVRPAQPCPALCGCQARASVPGTALPCFVRLSGSCTRARHSPALLCPALPLGAR